MLFRSSSANLSWCLQSGAGSRTWPPARIWRVRSGCIWRAGLVGTEPGAWSAQDSSVPGILPALPPHPAREDHRWGRASGPHGRLRVSPRLPQCPLSQAVPADAPHALPSCTVRKRAQGDWGLGPGRTTCSPDAAGPTQTRLLPAKCCPLRRPPRSWFQRGAQPPPAGPQPHSQVMASHVGEALL